VDENPPASLQLDGFVIDDEDLRLAARR